MLKNWIKIAFRSFAKNKLATFINVFGLTLGLVGLVLTLLYQNDQYSYDRWIKDSDRIFALAHKFGEDIWGVSNPQMEQAKAKIPEIEEILMVDATGYKSSILEFENNSVYTEKIINSTSNFFDFFPYVFIEGSAQDIKTSGNIAISENFARKLFKDKDPINQTIKAGNLSLVVKAVYRLSHKSSIMPDVVISYSKMDEYWGNYNYNAYIKTKNDISSDQLRKSYDKNVLDESLKQNAQKEGLTVEELKNKYQFQSIVSPLPESRFDVKSSLTLYEPYGNRTIIQIMYGISLLILVISIVNFINLSLAGAIKRAKEIGVRKAMGATRKNIVGQSLFETFLLTLFSSLLSLVMIELLLNPFNRFMQTNIEVNYGLFLVQIIGIAIFTTILTGIIPALYLSKFQSIEVLKGSFSRSAKGIYIRNGMLAFQFMIAAFFFTGSLIVYLQIRYLDKLDLGFNKEQIMVLNFRYNSNPFEEYEHIKTYLKNINGITEVNSARPLAGSNIGYSTTEIELQGKTVGGVLYNSVDFGYPEMMGMDLLKGRFLSSEYASDTVNNVVINETLAKELGIYDNPVNQKLNKELNVVGMVKDFHVFDAFSPIKPLIMEHWISEKKHMVYNMGNILVKFKPENLDEIISNLEVYWPQKVITTKPFDYTFLDQNFAKTYEQYLKQQQIFGIMTGLIILIALLGLYAMSSFIIEQRLKEVAIRKTLGAETKDIILKFSKPYLIIGATGILLAFPITYYAADLWLQNFSYRIPIPWLAFVFSFVILLLMAFLVVSIKAWRTTKINLVTYLKYE